MDINKVMSWTDQRRLLWQITQEYWNSDRHTQNWRNKMQNIAADYLLPEATGEDRIKDRSVLQNLNIRLSVFVADDIQVTNVPMSGQLGADIAKNCDKVFQSNFRTMDMREKYRDVIYDDWLYWVGVMAVDGWNDHSQEPILSYIDSRLCYPDPKNWQDSKMRYFGTKLKKDYWELLNDDAYDINQVNKVKFATDEDQRQVERWDNAVKGYTEVDNGENLIELYNHLTVFREEWEESHLYLTTLGADRSEFVRIVKIRPLTDAEKADPSKVDLGVKLFRGKPLKGSFAGVSLVDDLGQYQDLLTLFTNLQTEQAKEAALGGRKYVPTTLGVDMDDVANWTGAWEIIPYTPEGGLTAQNAIYEEQPRQISPITSNQVARLEQLKQQADPASTSLATGVGTPWSQTKAEIQTLQQNINQVLSYMQSNYMASLMSLWESIYKSYARNMSSQRKKEIVVVDAGGNPDNYGFKKNQFISKWDVYIVVKSKREEEAKNEKQYAQTLSFYDAIRQGLGNTTEGKILDRYLMEKSNSWIDPTTIISYTPDERNAYDDLVLLNNNEDVSAPEGGQDHNAYINIYKTGLQTQARERAILARELILEEEKTTRPETPVEQWGWSASWLGASMVAADNAQWKDVNLWSI